MNFNVISIMGDLVASSLSFGVVGASFAKDLNKLNLINPREFTEDVHQTIDDRPYGGGDGMLMMAEPLEKSLQSLNIADQESVLYLSPQGRQWNDSWASEIAQQKSLTLICGRYGGVDQRFLSRHQISEVSIGDYVLSGGELAAAVMIDSIVRKIPGVLGHVDSASVDSFANQGLLEAPSFTRPREYAGMEVPAVLLEGNHSKIDTYRENLSLLVTLQKRPDILQVRGFDQWQSLLQFLEKLSPEEILSLGLPVAELRQKIAERL